MDDILTNAGAVAQAPDQPTDVSPQAGAPNLGQGEHQAPTPTSAAPQPKDGASEPQPQRTIPYEEYEELQRRYEETDGMVSRLREMAEANIAQEEWNKYKAGVVDELRRAIDNSNGDDEATYAALQNVLSARLDGVRDDFNNKFTEYQDQMKGWATDFEWNNTRESEADALIKSHNLNPAMKKKLLEAPTREEMVRAAETAKYLTDLYMTQGVNDAIQQQGEQRRSSGVDAIGNINSGPVNQQPLKPGNANEPHLRSALKEMLGL